MAITRAYISGPLQAAKDLAAARDFYERLAEVCVDAGIVPYLPHRRTDPQLHTEASSVSVFRCDRTAIGECDLLIADIGQPSSGVGAELGLAISSHLPIIAIHRANEQPSRFVLGMLEDYEAAVVITFERVESLSGSLGRALAEFVESPELDDQPVYRLHLI
jgi:nucleoside 2-deoxyribosyltransferase